MTKDEYLDKSDEIYAQKFLEWYNNTTETIDLKPLKIWFRSVAKTAYDEGYKKGQNENAGYIYE